MRILVLGATGFIGFNLVLELRRVGWDVAAVARESSRLSREGVLASIRSSGASVLFSEGLGLESLRRIFKDQRPDVVVNAVGLLRGGRGDLEEAHVEIPRRAVQALSDAGGGSLFVHISSTGASDFSRPERPLGEEEAHCAHLERLPTWYERTKCLGELEVSRISKKRGLGHVILRPNLVVGRHNLHPEWRRLLTISRLGVFVDLPGVTSLVDVEDLASAVVGVISSPGAHNDYYHVASPEPIGLREISSIALEAAGSRPRIRVGRGLLALARSLPLGEIDRRFLQLLDKDTRISPNKLLNRLPGLRLKSSREAFKNYMNWLASRQGRGKPRAGETPS